MKLRVKRSKVVLRPDCSRVFFRPFEPGSRERVLRILARVTALSEAEAERESRQVLNDFVKRHQRARDFLLQRFAAVEEQLITDHPLSECRKLLIGAHFTLEYSLEAAALFNPSIVPHPDQSNLPKGHQRFILSLRATGEGHVSSIVFRQGVVDAEGNIEVHPPAPFVTVPEVHLDPTYEKQLFERKLIELGLLNPFIQSVLAQLPEYFQASEVQAVLDASLRGNHGLSAKEQEAADDILALVRGNYEIDFTDTRCPSERVIFPNTPAESRGIEDARFVAFREEDGSACYYATYTAFDGRVPLPQLLKTEDFVHFKISTLNGPQVQNKGMALFPRRVNGHYAMLSRQDGENLFLMYSDLLYFWYEKRLLLRPTLPWEFVQVGNCGSPIETEAGWLVLTHGVGPMRRYVMGAILLDLDDPERVIGRLPEPLLTPNEEEREGYVPNVVYSCGAMVHHDRLILPYAMSDQSTTFATVPLNDLLDELVQHPPQRL